MRGVTKYILNRIDVLLLVTAALVILMGGVKWT